MTAGPGPHCNLKLFTGSSGRPKMIATHTRCRMLTTEADAVLAVVKGKVTVRLQGGVEGVTHTLFTD